MKRCIFLVIIIFLAVYVTSCADEQRERTSAEQISDTETFIPPTGKADDTKTQGYGPWSTRILIATSLDRITWTKTNTIFSDQADVPDAILDSEGRIFVYYITWAEEARNRIVVGISEDNGETWAYKKVTLETPTSWSPPVDPDVVVLEDGTIRMYFTCDPNDGNGPRTYSALSSDGITFSMEEEVRFQKQKSMVLDPTVLKINGTWHYFAGGAPKEQNYHAVSTDGLTFEEQEYLSFSDNFKMGNGIVWENGKYLFYGFEGGMPTKDFEPKIKAVETSDGYRWTSVEEIKLEVDTENGLETDFVKDPGIVKRTDGTYMMFYVTQIPD